MTDEILKKLKTTYSTMILECGFLTERKGDERFAKWGNKVVRDITKHWEDTPTRRRLSIPGYDLIVSIEDEPGESAHGYFTREKSTKTPVIILNVHRFCEDLYNAKDWLGVIKFMKRIIHHEVIHYINYLNYNNKEKILYKSKDEFNNSQEFNAYFHQLRKLLRDGLTSLKRSKGSFEGTFGATVQDFIKLAFNMLHKINNDIVGMIRSDTQYHKKWLNRLYQLYFELRDIYYEGRIKSYSQGTL